jgi:phosphoribosyl 1,2-cyclic phosphate phosphodiesterase
MQLTFLGTGTSVGVPVIGCRCPICTSTNPRNKRLRTSALLEVGGLNILVDVGPDFRQQALNALVERIDAILLTHQHADHVAGLDDVRPLNFAQRAPIPLYGTAPTLAFIRERFGYAFADTSHGSTKPSLELVEIDRVTPFSIGPVAVTPFDVQHGSWTITGYRIGALGYVTDANALSPQARERLRDLDVLVLNALGHDSHPMHFSLPEALAVIEELRPRRAFLVHLSHRIDHEVTNATLPAYIQLAYDGLKVDVCE